MLLDPQAEELLKKLADSGTQSRRRLHLCIRLVKGALAENGVKRLNIRYIGLSHLPGQDRSSSAYSSSKAVLS